MSAQFLSLAALLCVVIGAAHSWLGERRLIGPLLDPAQRHGILQRRFARDVLRFGWHITTLAWWGIGAAFAAFATGGSQAAPRLAIFALSASMLLTGVVILVSGRGRHWAWPVFFAIAALACTAA